jgi:hypothetical protein
MKDSVTLSYFPDNNGKYAHEEPFGRLHGKRYVI